MTDVSQRCERTVASAAAAASGSSLLYLAVSGDFAGRLIGKKGQNVQELQARTGARLQLSDLGSDETLVEVNGPCQCVDDACFLLVDDLARIQKLRVAGSKIGLASANVQLAVLILEDLSDWVNSDLRRQVETATASDENTLAPEEKGTGQEAEAGESLQAPTRAVEMELLGYAEVSGRRFRKLLLSGHPRRVGSVVRTVRCRIRRYSRWADAKVREPPAVPLMLLESDPPDDFVSTENFLLGLPKGCESRLSETSYKDLLGQIQEDSGATARVRAEGVGPGGACLEIAGCCFSKLTAAVEVPALLIQLSCEDASGDGSLQVWLRTDGPCALTTDAISAASSSRGVRAVVGQKTLQVGASFSRSVQLHGQLGPLCAAARALALESERKAWAYVRKHGQPSLLVDYLSRWFGREAGRMLRERSGSQHATNTSRKIQAADAGEDDATASKRPKSTAKSPSPVLPVMGPHLPDLDASDAMQEEPQKNDDDDDEEEELVVLPPASLLPLNLASEETSELWEETLPVLPEPPTPPEPLLPEMKAKEAPSWQAQVPPPEVPEAPAPDTDSDSDYRPGPSEDPLWHRRQELLKKLNQLG